MDTCFKCKNEPVVQMHPLGWKDLTDYIRVCDIHLISGLEHYSRDGAVVVDRLVLTATTKGEAN